MGDLEVLGECRALEICDSDPAPPFNLAPGVSLMATAPLHSGGQTGGQAGCEDCLGKAKVKMDMANFKRNRCGISADAGARPADS